MIKYNAANKVLTMDLVDLEHCGFCFGDFAAELTLASITDPDAQWPVMVVVNFAGGCVVAESTPASALENQRRAREKFDAMIGKIKE